MAPRSTLLLALCACASAAPALKYVGCGQTSNGFQATIAVTTNGTSKTLVDPDASAAFNYTVVFTNGGKQTTVAVQDGLATLTQYTGASVTAQLQNGVVPIGTVYPVPALATTTCIKPLSEHPSS